MEYSGFRAIIIRDGKIALMERWNRNRHYYVLPGGHLEEGESGTECIIREIKEELNIDIIPRAIVYDLVDYRMQGIFIADWTGGTIGKTDAPEYREDRVGGDYAPVLVDLKKLKHILLVPQPLKMQLLKDLQEGTLMTREKTRISSKYRYSECKYGKK